MSFPPSKLVWEYYPGQGIEIQWLATFGEGNGYYLSGHENSNLRQLLGEVIPLATKRAGGIAWEYMFRFDGGAPPWTSGLSQGTALQVLARAWSRFKEPAYLDRRAAGARHLPDAAAAGRAREHTRRRAVRRVHLRPAATASSTASSSRWSGSTTTPRSPRTRSGWRCSKPATPRPRADVPHYDTGAWSLYDQFGESDLNYHELLTEFLQHLCERTRKGAPTRPRARPAPPPPAAPTHYRTTLAPAPAAGTARRERRRPSHARASAAPTSAQIPGDQIYCTTAQHFTRRPAHPAGRLAALHQAPAGAHARACRSRCRRSRPSR